MAVASAVCAKCERGVPMKLYVHKEDYELLRLALANLKVLAHVERDDTKLAHIRALDIELIRQRNKQK